MKCNNGQEEYIKMTNKIKVSFEKKYIDLIKSLSYAWGGKVNWLLLYWVDTSDLI